MEQVEVIDLALRLLNKPDWHYKLKPTSEDHASSTDRAAVEKIFLVVYGRQLDSDTSGVHWLALTALLQAIAHNGFFRPRRSLWQVLFYLYSLGLGVAVFAIWWYFLPKG